MILKQSNGGVDVTLKVNWKRTNRGLWLAGIAILIVAISVMIDNYQFKNEKDDIVNVVQNFTNEVEEALISPKDIIDKKASWDEAGIEAEKESINEAYKKYWTGTGVVTYLEEYRGIGNLKEDMDIMFEEMMENKGYFKDLKIDLGTAKVSQYGPDGAAVTMECEIDATYLGIDTVFYGIGAEYGMYYYDNGYDGYYEDATVDMEVSVDKMEEDKEQEGSFSYSFEMTFVLLREDGQWKISGVTYF